ncbi:pyruvate ferredoxin oxidoreductase, alpha subunit [Desulfurococcaceae archaeon AG1]|jgi:pyruvate/2-oxoacid:ferredoxin oxidoreductase alpha subunit|nr:pyruvate ferredoxin oxidoreductase, alpha subunit [Desulfurococcaceae archaeon AG1]
METKLESRVRQTRVILNSNYAAAYAVRDADVDVISAYPITPQTGVVEKLSEMIAEGELDAEMIHVESEHSALSAIIGASAVGARVFTATSSQGLEYMHEVLHIASGMRLPLVMAIATRALSAPISIWNDYSDLMNVRDTSWITFIASTAQEVYDSIIEAYMVSEDPRILLPSIVAYDGFWMSHTYEPLYIPEDRKTVLEMLPRRPRYTLDPDNPITMGSIVNPDWYYEIKYQQVEAMKEAYRVIREADAKIEENLGRVYKPVESYLAEDSEILVLTYGGIYGTLQTAVDLLRSEGLKVGALRLRLWRPFPARDLKTLVEDAKTLIVVDRAISYGASIEGPVALETIAALYREGLYPTIASFIAGIGGRPVSEDDFRDMVKKALELGERALKIGSIHWGVRGAEYE